MGNKNTPVMMFNINLTSFRYINSPESNTNLIAVLEMTFIIFNLYMQAIKI